MRYPLTKVFVTQKFGERPLAYKKYGMNGHNGVDFRTRFWDSPLGKRFVLAAAAGEVIEIGTGRISGYGIFIRLRHSDGSQTVYGHLDRAFVFLGQLLDEGNIMGITDNTGDSTGAHLHFGYRPPNWNINNGFKGYVDPLPLLT